MVPTGTSRKIRLRFLQIVSFVVLGYLLISGLVLTQAASQPTLASLRALQTGTNLFLNDPTTANAAFAKSNDEANNALTQHRRTPWWSRLLAPLPPFRWQVELVKGSAYLADAGKAAATLSASFPRNVTPSSATLSDLLITSDQTYGAWYDVHQGDIQRLHDQLDAANTQLAHVPGIAVLGQRQSFLQLKHDLRSTADQLQDIDQLSQLSEHLLATGNMIDLVFPAESGPGEYIRLTGKDGRIGAVTFVDQPSSLSPTPFWIDTTPPNGVAAALLIQPNFLRNLLKQAGSVTLTAGSQPITDPSWNGSQPLTLLDPLLATLSSKPGSLSQVYALAGEAVRKKDIQMSLQQPQTLIHDIFPLDQPLAGNWLKVSCGNTSIQTDTLDRVATPWKHRMVQHLSITCSSSGPATVYLPQDATVLDGSKSEKEQNYTLATLNKSGDEYQLTYALPWSFSEWHQVTFLKTATEQQTLDGMGFKGKVQSNLVLHSIFW